LADAQWTFKPSAAVWSVEECAEHIILAEDFLFGSAPAAIVPTGKIASPAEAAGIFAAKRDRHIVV
jgi:hypothetical protein